MDSSFPVKRARRLLRDGDAKTAAALLTEWLRDSPGDTRARDFLASAFYHLGAYDEAERQLRRVVGEWPEKARCRANLALVLRKLGRLDEAFEMADEALKLDPGHQTARAEMARTRRLLRLPVCGNCAMPVERADELTCPHCGWTYHQACWDEMPFCENPACSSGATGPQKAEPKPEQPQVVPKADRGGCLGRSAMVLALGLAAAVALIAQAV